VSHLAVAEAAAVGRPDELKGQALVVFVTLKPGHEPGDVTCSIFRRVASEGIKLDAGLFDTLLYAYTRQAEDTLRFYAADAAMNGLHFPRHEEETAVSTFVRSIRLAAKIHMEEPMFWPLIPNWNRVESAMPDFLDDLNKAVALDNHLDADAA
jgi:glucosyl-3-phosphoglycerate synthase